MRLNPLTPNRTRLRQTGSQASSIQIHRKAPSTGSQPQKHNLYSHPRSSETAPASPTTTIHPARRQPSSYPAHASIYHPGRRPHAYIASSLPSWLSRARTRTYALAVSSLSNLPLRHPSLLIPAVLSLVLVPVVPVVLGSGCRQSQTLSRAVRTVPPNRSTGTGL